MNCFKCEGVLITPEYEFMKSIGRHNEFNYEEGVCWRCSNDYWGGIESIFNQLGMDKHEVFFMIEDHLNHKLENEEKENSIEKNAEKLAKIYHIPF